MANSLSDQLLKAGLINQDKIDQAEQDKQQRKEAAKKKRQQSHNQKNAPKPKQSAKQQKRKQPASDLAQFYKARATEEKAEREAEEKAKREAAALRKKTRKQIRDLVNDNLKNDPAAEIRYNFVIGTNIKYLFVTEAQQTALSAGELAITFVDGKRCLIPTEIGKQILALDPNKPVVISEPDTEEAKAEAAAPPDAPDAPTESAD